MMPLLLGNFSYPVYEGQRGTKIRKLVGAHNMVLVNDIPMGKFWQLVMDIDEFLSFERRNTAPAGNASFVG